MSLIPLQLRYQFDPSGDDVANLVTGETHEIPPINRRIIVPRMGAFYARSMRIRNQQRDLVLGVDYHLAGFFQDATIATGQDVNVMIYFEAGIQGEVTLTYQVVGGMYTGIFETIQDYVNALLVDPRKVKWDDILNKPELYVPMEHFHDINDVYGLNYLIPKLEEIRLAIMRVRSKEMRKIYDRILRIRNDVDKVVAQANQQLGENRTLTAGLQAEINLLKSNITTLTNELASLRNQNGLAEKVAALETAANQLKSNDNIFNNQINDINTRIDSLLTSNGQYTELMNRFDALVDRTTGKLKQVAYSTTTDRNNVVTISSAGVIDSTPLKYKDVNKSFAVKNFYVDAVAGNDNNNGTSKATPFRTVEKAMVSIQYGRNTTIYLKENQEHLVLPGTFKPIIDTVVGIGSYTTETTAGYVIGLATLKCGNNTARASKWDASRNSNMCFELRGGATLLFRGIHLVLNTYNTNLNNHEAGVINSSYYSSVANNLVDINNACKLTFTNAHDRLIADMNGGLFTLTMDEGLFNTAGKLNGPGRMFYKTSTTTHIRIRRPGDATGQEIPNLSADGVAQVKKYFPHLRRSLNSLHGGAIANIMPTVLPWANNNELSDLSASLLPSMVSSDTGNKLSVRNNKLYVDGIIPISNAAGNLINMRTDGLFAAAPPGLTYDTISALPEKAWAKGTSILAKGVDGNWYRMVPPESLFQNIGVSISSNKVIQDVGSIFKVKYIVTNSGVARNDKTTLTITLPTQNQRTAYTVGNYRETLQRGTRFVKTSDTTWDIYGLESSGTFTLEFDLTPTTFGTYQLGGQVTVNAEVDTVSSDNNASLLLTANTVIDTNYVPSVNCPMIIATNLSDGNQQLRAVKTTTNANTGAISIDREFMTVSFNKINRTKLNGVRIKLQNASSIIGKCTLATANRSFTASAGGSISGSNTISWMYTIDRPTLKINGATANIMVDEDGPSSWFVPMLQRNYSNDATTARMLVNMAYRLGDSNEWLFGLSSLDANATIYQRNVGVPVYTFDATTGILTFNEMDDDIISAIIACRPAGNNCVWQLFILSCKSDVITVSNEYTFTGLNQTYINKTTDISFNSGGYYINGNFSFRFTKNATPHVKTIGTQYDVNIPKNTATNFTITGNIDLLTFIPVQGNITLTKENDTTLRIVTTNRVTSTDNINLGLIRINFV